MSSVARYLVENHSKLARVAVPVSLMFGFCYTAAYGTNPLRDAQATITGQQQADTYWRASATWPTHWP